MGIFDFLKQAKEKNENVNDKSAALEPDLPYPFGYKIGWYAIKNETSKTVIEKLKLKIISESNWKNGIIHAYNSRKHLFVSPAVKGYVLVINIFPGDKHDIVKEHSLHFGEFQYFGSHRITEYNAWAKFCDGKVIRSYCYVGESGEVTWCEGNLTPEEINLGFDIFPSNTEELLSDDFDYENIPDEAAVLAVAKSWGIDTAFEDGVYDKGTGFICEFKS